MVARVFGRMPSGCQVFARTFGEIAMCFLGCFGRLLCVCYVVARVLNKVAMLFYEQW